MFTDADKADAHWQEDLVDDVKGEAAKFGEVVHCHVEPNSKVRRVLCFVTVIPAAAKLRQRCTHFSSLSWLTWQTLATLRSLSRIKQHANQCPCTLHCFFTAAHHLTAAVAELGSAHAHLQRRSVRAVPVTFASVVVDD